MGSAIVLEHGLENLSVICIMLREQWDLWVPTSIDLNLDLFFTCFESGQQGWIGIYEPSAP